MPSEPNPYGTSGSSTVPAAAKLEPGAKFGRLTLIQPSGKSADHHRRWECFCECGRTAFVVSNSLKYGHTKSCGCLRSEASQKRIKREGVWNEGKSYAIGGGERCYKTRHSWAKAVIRHYGNRCQRCGWDKARCDAHHINPKAEGGLHTIANGMVICPNCHREEHSR